LDAEGPYWSARHPGRGCARLAIAVAAGGPTAAAWGRSAAAIWQLLDQHPGTPEIVIPHARQAKIDGVVVHRSLDLCPEHVTLRDHIRVTNPLVTTLDLGVVLGPLDVADVIIWARQLKLFNPDAIRATVQRLARPGRTGVRNVRQALDLIMIGDRPAESVLELRFHLGPGKLLPDYEYQWAVKIRGQRYYIDFAYPSVKVAIEVDGYEKRRAKEALDRDDRRQNMLVLDGWTVLRFTWVRVLFDPAGVAAEVLAALGHLGYRFGS
jgi:very-short-patch-repair endonuclease